MRVTFVRHGESQSNSDGRWQGQGDSPLSDHGRNQAARAAERLRDVPYVRVVSSDLSRARDTARALGIEPEVDPGLREIDVGRWEGLRRAEVLEKFPDEIAALLRGEDVRIGGGESWRDATVRSRAALDAHLAKMSTGEELAVFSHGGVITSLFLDVVGVGWRRPQPLGHMVNTAISVAHFDGAGAIVERYNDATHVPETAAWRRSLFGSDDTVVGYLVIDDSTNIADLARKKSIFDECVRIFAVDETLHDAAHQLGTALGIEADTSLADSTFESVARGISGQRVVVLCRATEAESRVNEVVESISLTARFGPLRAGSLSHIARTRSTLLLIDFGTIVLDP